MNVSDLPALNASLNALAATFLLWGRWEIARLNIARHRLAMCLALGASALFLTSYLIYHFNTQTVTTYPGEGWDRTFYYFVLVTHIPLAALQLPFIFLAFYRGFRGEIAQHRRLVRWVWPVWMYVSVTGVVIYLMLYG